MLLSSWTGGKSSRPTQPRLSAVLQAAGNAISSIHNKALGPFITTFAANYSQASVILFDYATWQQGILANATANGFTNTNDFCYSKSYERDDYVICDNPEEYMYWDNYHFSGHTHRLWGAAVAAQLRPYVTPTPTVTASRKLLGRSTRHTVISNDMFGRPLHVYN